MRQRSQFCPACFGRIDADARVCPKCAADLAALSERDHLDKLLGALDHPLAGVRLRAVVALGWRADPQGAGALERLTLRHPADVVEGLAVVDALARLGAAGLASLDRLAARHPAHAVREAALAASKGRRPERMC